MPTTSEASTPSRRAIIKAESKGSPVENHLQQQFKFTLRPYPRQVHFFQLTLSQTQLTLDPNSR
jgi:hypothetical protein